MATAPFKPPGSPATSFPPRGVLGTGTRPPASAAPKAAPPKAAPTAAITVKAKLVPPIVAAWQPPNVAEMRGIRAQVQKEREESASRQGEFKFKEGLNKIRILPGRGVANPFYEVWLHFLRNPHRPDMPGKPVPCGLKMRGGRCVVCERMKDLRAAGDEVSVNVSKDLRAGRRIYFNMIDLADLSRGVQRGSVGIKLYDELLLVMCGDESDEENFPPIDYTHPQKGYTIQVEKTVGNKADIKNTTKYSSPRLATAPSAIPIEDWQAKMFDLTKAIEAMTDDRMLAILEGTDEDPAPAEIPHAGGNMADDL